MLEYKDCMGLTQNNNIMKNLENLTIDQKFEYLCELQFKAIELEDWEEVEKLEILINKLNIL